MLLVSCNQIISPPTNGRNENRQVFIGNRAAIFFQFFLRRHRNNLKHYCRHVMLKDRAYCRKFPGHRTFDFFHVVWPCCRMQKWQVMTQKIEDKPLRGFYRDEPGEDDVRVEKDLNSFFCQTFFGIARPFLSVNLPGVLIP